MPVSDILGQTVHMGISRVTKKLGSTGNGDWLTPKHTSPHVTMPNLVILHQRV